MTTYNPRMRSVFVALCSLAAFGLVSGISMVTSGILLEIGRVIVSGVFLIIVGGVSTVVAGIWASDGAPPPLKVRRKPSDQDWTEFREWQNNIQGRELR